MNSLTIVAIAIVALAAGYVLYGRWLAKSWGIDPKAKTPAYTHEDGEDYIPTPKLVVFSHQFSSIAGAGPVTGPIIAAMFGWLPVLLWLIIGGIFFGAVQEFYLFQLDDNGKSTKLPYDNASYMDIAPEDSGENIRREICLTLEQMGIQPESSHHEEGPGQNEIDFRYSNPLTAADNAMTFQTVVKTIAQQNGIFADFKPKPLEHAPGNGFHINISVKSSDSTDNMNYLIAGILDKISDMTIFLNPTENSYKRFGKNKAPKYISWSNENRSQLIRVPSAIGKYRRVELRSPDPSANTYLAFALIIYAILDGIQNKTELPAPSDINLYKADKDILTSFKQLPENFKSACTTAANSDFIRKYIPDAILNIYCNR